MLPPSGDQAGCRASLKASVMGFASPPVAGTTHNVPCRSNTSCLPSGEADTDIDVPSDTVMVRSLSLWLARGASRLPVVHDTHPPRSANAANATDVQRTLIEASFGPVLGLEIGQTSRQRLDP